MGEPRVGFSEAVGRMPAEWQATVVPLPFVNSLAYQFSILQVLGGLPALGRRQKSASRCSCWLKSVPRVCENRGKCV